MLRDTLHEHKEHGPTPVTQDEGPTPRSIALECLTNTAGDWAKAAQLMRSRIDEDDALFRVLLAPMIDSAIWQVIRSVSNEQRIKYTRAANADDSSGLNRIAERTIKSWLDYPLSGGLRLGDADKAKLLAEAEMHKALAVGNEQKSRLFELIAKRVDGKRVSQVLDSDQIEKIWKKVTC